MESAPPDTVPFAFMIHGLDTGFLVAAEALEHAEHVAARDTLARLFAASDLIAIAPVSRRASHSPRHHEAILVITLS